MAEIEKHGQGDAQISQKQADNAQAWEKIRKYQEEETDLSVKIAGIVPSGVIAYVEGIRGFIPASQLAMFYVEATEEWLGKTIEARIINCDEAKKKLVLSAKVILKEKEKEEHNRRISMLIPESVVEGTVESLMPYGAFVDLGDGVSGLVHISQISRKRIEKPSEVLKEGQKVKVKILNTDDNKVSLSMKALEEEMIDTEQSEAVKEYISEENVSTSLGDLLSGLKL